MHVPEAGIFTELNLDKERAAGHEFLPELALSEPTKGGEQAVELIDERDGLALERERQEPAAGTLLPEAEGDGGDEGRTLPAGAGFTVSVVAMVGDEAQLLAVDRQPQVRAAVAEGVECPLARPDANEALVDTPARLCPPGMAETLFEGGGGGAVPGVEWPIARVG